MLNQAIYKISIISSISNGVDSPIQIPAAKDVEVPGINELIDITIVLFSQHKDKIDGILALYGEGYYLLSSQINTQLLGFGSLAPNDVDLIENSVENS